MKINIVSTAEKLAKIAAQASFDFWQDEKFRQLVDFDKIPKTEQDRIFNELEVTILGLIAARAIQQPVLIKLQQETSQAFIKLLQEVGIEEAHLDTWKLLIRLRFKEYKEDYKLLWKESEKWEEIKNSGENRIIWARVQALSLEGVKHIRRGVLEKEDPLIGYFRGWMMAIDMIITKILDEEIKMSKVGIN